MEDITINSMQLLTSYGALGVITVYFMWKDMTITKKLEETLHNFTVTLETFFRCMENEDK